MKKLSLTLGIALMLCSQLNAKDIFKQHGFDKEPLTLSNGRYNEFFNNEEVVQIGSVLLDTRTNKIVAFIKEETNTTYKAELSSRWLSIDPLAAKYPQVSPYVYCVNNPIIYIDPDGMDWILSTGNKISWYGGDTGDKSNLVRTFKATSGALGHQVASEQNKRDQGPTPDGKYSINLKPEPDRKAEIASNGQLKRSTEGGIENLEGMKMDGDNENLYTSEDWGDNRAKLDAEEVTGATSGERDNNSYYFHDSEKGYTHGCTEVETGLFDQLKDYRSQGNGKIDVIIQYPAEDHKTNGGTKKVN